MAGHQWPHGHPGNRVSLNQPEIGRIPARAIRGMPDAEASAAKRAEFHTCATPYRATVVLPHPASTRNLALAEERHPRGGIPGAAAEGRRPYQPEARRLGRGPHTRTMAARPLTFRAVVALDAIRPAQKFA